MVAHRSLRRAALLGAVAALLAGVVGVAPIQAVGLGWTVDSTGDAGDQNTGNILCRTLVGTCTLRAAIQQANAIDPGVGNHHTITLPAETITMFLIGAGEDNALTGDYDIKHSVTIRGQGAGDTIIQGSATSAEDAIDRIFDIQALGAEVVFKDLTIRRGNAHLIPGGAVNVSSASAAITLDHVALTQNRAFDEVGAGIRARKGPLTILDSRITNNDAPDGAVVDVNGGNLTVRRTTFANNFVWNGAVDLHGDGSGLIDRSTFSGQTTNGPTASAVMVGHGSTDLTEMTIRNSTFAGNKGAGSTVIVGARSVNLDIVSSTVAGNAGVGISSSVTTSLRNTILSGNADGNCSEFPTSLGHNLDTGTTCHLDGPGDIAGGDADLAALANNGGSTRTRALGPESDAIDAGSSCPDIDQRGVARPKDGDDDGSAACDIGAYEAPKGTAATPLPTLAPTTSPTGAPSQAPSEAPAPTDGPTDSPGVTVAPSTDAPSTDAPAPTAGAATGEPGAATIAPSPTPGSSSAPVPAGTGDAGGLVVPIVLGAILLALVLLFFVARRRRPPETT